MKTTTAPTTNPYHNIAELYDLEHDNFDDDIDTFLNFAHVVGDPILDMGCGSGRITVPLAEAGFRVTGVDSSRPMLERAKQRCAAHNLDDMVALVEKDLRHVDQAPGGPFGLVICSLNSLMHLTTPADQRAALEAAHRALDPKGQLIIDILNPSVEQLTHMLSGPQLENSWTLDDGSTIDKWSHRKPSEQLQVLDTLLWYDWTYPDSTVKRTRASFPLRYIHPSELALMLELSGFVEPIFYGNYDLDPYGNDAERLLVTAEVQPAPKSQD